MSNELIWILYLLFDFSAILILYRLFGKPALFAAIVLNIVVCNIQVVKLITLFGITTTAGQILYGSTFFATDMLGECYGKKEARKGVLLGFCSLLVALVSFQVMVNFAPDSHDKMHDALAQVFGLYPRIVLGSLVAYLISQLHDVWAFHMWKKKTKGKWLLLRNNASTWASQLIDTVIFCFIAFWGVVPPHVFWSIMWTTYAFKVLVGALDTPFIYLGRKVFLDHHSEPSNIRSDFLGVKT
ncbi:MAG: queuosine precursor transporter [Halobacteriota archaeon]|nr:queuosine precursor transporter [Halobacteriota archaeon]